MGGGGRFPYPKYEIMQSIRVFANRSTYCPFGRDSRKLMVGCGLRARCVVAGRYVWTPTGGWWNNPPNWRRNTAVGLVASWSVAYLAWQVGKKTEVGSACVVLRL